MAGEMSNPNPTPYIHLAEMDPQRLAFSVMVRAEAVTPAIVRQLIPGVTTLREWSAHGLETPRLEEDCGNGKLYGENYVYTYHAEGPGTLHTFYFAEIRTPEEILEPIADLSYRTSDVYDWPNVLLSLRFTADPKRPLEVVVGGVAQPVPRLFRRIKWVDGGGYACQVNVRIYVSHTQFPDEIFKLDTPVPTPVDWEMENSEGNLPKCLHGYQYFPESQTTGYFINAGSVRDGVHFGQPHIIEETNHEDWRPHVFRENVKQVRGLWMLEQLEVIPPVGRREVFKV